MEEKAGPLAGKARTVSPLGCAGGVPLTYHGVANEESHMPWPGRGEERAAMLGQWEHQTEKPWTVQPSKAG